MASFRQDTQLLDAPDSGFVSDPAGQLARGRLTEAGIDPQVAFQSQAVLASRAGATR